MPPEPQTKRAIAFVDGQNLFHGAKEAFGYTYPNYNVAALSKAVCNAQGWQMEEIRFYTGVPDRSDNAFWHAFWTNKLLAMRRQGILAYNRPLRYRNKTVNLPDGTTHTFLVAEEKGIDVRLALDVIRLAHQGRYDVAIIFSQDQDMSEAADEVRTMSVEQDRWIKVACAFPDSPTLRNRRGINRTEWVRIDRATYNACIDPRDYRPARLP